MDGLFSSIHFWKNFVWAGSVFQAFWMTEWHYLFKLYNIEYQKCDLKFSLSTARLDLNDGFLKCISWYEAFFVVYKISWNLNATILCALHGQLIIKRNSCTEAAAMLWLFACGMAALFLGPNLKQQRVCVYRAHRHYVILARMHSCSGTSPLCAFYEKGNRTWVLSLNWHVCTFIFLFLTSIRQR